MREPLRWEKLTDRLRNKREEERRDRQWRPEVVKHWLQFCFSHGTAKETEAQKA